MWEGVVDCEGEKGGAFYPTDKESVRLWLL
jgi:hypothetical protein